MKKNLLLLGCLCVGAVCLSAQSFNLKIGAFQPSQGDKSLYNLWYINYENLFFSKTDLRNVTIACEYEYFLSRMIGLGLELSFYNRTIDTYYRDYEFEDGSPVNQYFRLRLTPLELNIKLYPLGHRRSFIPFIGFGPGLYFWRYEQGGTFIIFPSEATEEGYAITNDVAFGVQGRAGFVLRFARSAGISFEGKYHYAKGPLSHDFEDFDDFDLSGFSLMLGLNLYFR